MIFTQTIDFLTLIIIWMADGGPVVIPAPHWPDPLHSTYLLPNQHATLPWNLNEPAEPHCQRAALHLWVMAVSAVSRWAEGGGMMGVLEPS